MWRVRMKLCWIEMCIYTYDVEFIIQQRFIVRAYVERYADGLCRVHATN